MLGDYQILYMARELEAEVAAIRRARLRRAGLDALGRGSARRDRNIGFEATLLGRRIVARLSLQRVECAGET
jgi:hypothetical protein